MRRIFLALAVWLGLTASVAAQETTVTPYTGPSIPATTSQNFVFSGPPSGSGAPSFRGLVAGDIPSLSATYCALSGCTLTGALLETVAGGATTPIMRSNGAFAAGGSTVPPAWYLDCNQGTTTEPSFPATGVAVGVNTCSGFTGVFYEAWANGTVEFSVNTNGGEQLGASGSLTFIGRGILSSPGAGGLQIGAADAASPVAQTLSFQSVIAGNANTGGANTIIRASLSNGTGTPGTLALQTSNNNAASGTQDTAVTGILIGATPGAVALPNLVTSSGAQTGTVCSGAAGNLTVDTTTTCLLSSIRWKEHVRNMESGLATIERLRPVSYDLKPQFNPAHLGRQVGLIAEEVQKVDSRLVGLGTDGKPNGVRYQQLTAVLIKAIQEQQAEIVALQARVAKLERGR